MRFNAGQELLASLAKHRPRYRSIVLASLLKLCCAEQPTQRSAAIGHVCALAALPECRKQISEFAEHAFTEAASMSVLNVVFDVETFLADIPRSTPAPADVEQSEERRAEWQKHQEQLRNLQAEKSASDARRIQAQGVVQHCSLLFALVGNVEQGVLLDLLAPAARLFSSLGPVFRTEVVTLIKSSIERCCAEKEPPTLCSVLERHFSASCTDLTLAVVSAASAAADGATRPISEELAAFAKARTAAEKEPRYLLPVLRALKSRDVLADAPLFLSQQKQVLAEFVNRALATPFFLDKVGLIREKKGGEVFF